MHVINNIIGARAEDNVKLTYKEFRRALRKLAQSINQNGEDSAGNRNTIDDLWYNHVVARKLELPPEEESSNDK